MLARIRKSMTGKDQGFTLIELLVVIIIIGILAAIAIPVFLNQRKKAVDASLKSDLRNAAVVMETWMVDNTGVTIPNSTVWITAATPESDKGALATVTLSPGNSIWLTHSASNLTGAYCLQAYNPGASAATGDLRLMYYSLQGGQQPTLAAEGSGCA